MPADLPKTRLQSGYRFKNRLAIAVITAIDFCTGILPRRKSALPEEVRRILVMKPDHLGDLLMTTAVIPLIAARYPGAAIDLLCGPWGKGVVTGNRFLRSIICLNHPFYNRSPAPLVRKLLDFWQSLMHTIKILRQERYDLCLNLRDAGGDLILLARIGGCRHVIGHGTGGFRALLDTVVSWEEGRHEVEHYLEVLRPLGIVAALPDLRYELKPQAADETRLARLLAEAVREPYVVIHPGSGDRRKLRPAADWAQLIDGLDPALQVVITGTGDEQPLFADIAARTSRKLLSLMGELTVPQLYLLFHGAVRVYALDSLAAHLGAAAGVATTVYWSATNDPGQWRPLGPGVTLLASQDGRKLQ